ncbi:hypothetical protein GC105_15485 [Alkalibaculum sp. M08DMB]|uniref:Fluoroacetyl-CoA-specific thioesterase-like domain-containing protein n=1 Tax=Alkalibaculum sporogenes TaxID=2655001 RepID=A0A6A7KCC9_9FIRM|nr:thioesterase family protein [Alkalibaculum sporogenes]MPW27178.1 hypothetical protein [Alkalibaculum sporogenes]
MSLSKYIGSMNKIEKKVRETETAMAFGSGEIEVYSTPNMIGLMENAALSLVQPMLEKGYSTVGTRVDIKHIAATPVGMKVTVQAELIEVDRKRLVFNVSAWDEKEMIGEGIHERFVVEIKKFMEKVQNK